MAPELRTGCHQVKYLVIISDVEIHRVSVSTQPEFIYGKGLPPIKVTFRRSERQ